MKSNNILNVLIIRSIFIALTSALLGFLSTSISGKSLFFIPILILILLIIQIVALVRQNRNLNSRIIDYIKTLKSSQLLSKNEGNSGNDSFSQIQESLNDLITLVQKSNYEKELHKQYLNLIVDYIKVGIISYNQKNEIVLINKSAKGFFKKDRLEKLDDFKEKNKDFYDEIIALANRTNKLIKINFNDEINTFTISKSILKIGNEVITNISFQDIRNEIVQSEIESWRRLIKVLRHEILNSITPISTLTDTILSIIQNEDGSDKAANQLNEDDLDDIRESMKSIKSRSNGLFEFVNIYREIDKIPTPKFEIVLISELLNSIKPLFDKIFKENNIDFTIHINDNELFLNADFALIQQVLINLIKNSIEALENTIKPFIKIFVKKTYNRIHIEIIDNGEGIPLDQINQIFIPLYTTKESGSGIGLYLAQQIIQLHHGTIQAKSNPTIETIFTLSF